MMMIFHAGRWKIIIILVEQPPNHLLMVRTKTYSAASVPDRRAQKAKSKRKEMKGGVVGHERLKRLYAHMKKKFSALQSRHDNLLRQYRVLWSLMAYHEHQAEQSGDVEPYEFGEFCGDVSGSIGDAVLDDGPPDSEKCKGGCHTWCAKGSMKKECKDCECVMCDACHSKYGGCCASCVGE